MVKALSNIFLREGSVEPQLKSCYCLLASSPVGKFCNSTLTIVRVQLNAMNTAIPLRITECNNKSCNLCNSAEKHETMSYKIGLTLRKMLPDTVLIFYLKNLLQAFTADQITYTKLNTTPQWRRFTSKSYLTSKVWKRKKSWKVRRAMMPQTINNNLWRKQKNCILKQHFKLFLWNWRMVKQFTRGDFSGGVNFYPNRGFKVPNSIREKWLTPYELSGAHFRVHQSIHPDGPLDNRLTQIWISKCNKILHPALDQLLVNGVDLIRYDRRFFS